LSDAQIERTIKQKLAKSKLNADHFTVSVLKGVATLEGQTGVMQHKGTATRIAKTSGANDVRNNIRVSNEAKAKATARLAAGRTASPRAPVLAPGAAKAIAAPAEPIPHASVVFSNAQSGH
jgi:hypothetical protein